MIKKIIKKNIIKGLVIYVGLILIIDLLLIITTPAQFLCIFIFMLWVIFIIIFCNDK